MAMSKGNRETVRLEAGEFKWFEIPGLGLCLVPAKIGVTVTELMRRKKYMSKSGAEIELLSAYGTDGKMFYTLRRSGNSFCYSGLSGSLEHLVNRINEANDESDIKFGEWL